MKNIKLKYWCQIALLLIFISQVSCNLDYENRDAITPDEVWTDPVMINAYLTNIHASMIPGWPGGASNSDEGLDGVGTLNMSAYLRGIINETDTNGGKFNYSNIDQINFFLNQLATVVSGSVLPEATKKQMAGQALFWRAWDYWYKIQAIGGVPLILKPQNYQDKESLFVPRNKTSECFAQIIADLDVAINSLPDTWTGAVYGRIDKGTAMAFKGYVLMWYASPLFNRSNDASRWETAYNANKAAVDFLKSVGKGLHPKFADIWLKERNEEVIMVNQFYYPDHPFDNAGIRELPLTKGKAWYNQPLLPLVMAFPKKDGTQLVLDPVQLSDETYNDNFLTEFYTNRDERLSATLLLPGTEYPTADRAPGGMLSGEQRYWNTRYFEEDTYKSMLIKQFAQNFGDVGLASCLSIKGLDQSLDRIRVGQAGLDWIQIRFAEVLMNYGECANEVGKDVETKDVLYKIRDRAGITPANNYGITANTKEEIREAYINERFIEFALENKRMGDLRRLMRYDIINSRKYRSGLYIVLKNNADLATFDYKSDMIRDANIRRKFKAVYKECLDSKPKDNTYKLDLNHWFYSIHADDIRQNSKIEQNNEWGGTFDPLK